LHVGYGEHRTDLFNTSHRTLCLFVRTSPISYTCLLLAPEPAPAGEVPEVRLGAQGLAESVCSAFSTQHDIPSGT